MSAPSSQSPELSLGGLPLLYDKDQQAGTFLRRYQPIEDLIAQVDFSISSQNNKHSSVGLSNIGLTLPNYPPPPPPRVNQLYWPTGAARWARGYFLASSSVAVSLAARCGTPQTLIAKVNDISLSAQVYCLPPRPVSCVEPAPYETLFLVPVVDDRYWWQFRNFGNKGKPTISDWSNLFEWLGTQLGISISVDTVPGSYLFPDPEEFTRRYDNAALILDAAAHSVGQRIVRQFNGTVRSINWSNSLLECDNNTDSRNPWWQIAGDDFLNKPVPAKVTVAFPRVDCGVPSCDRRFYTQNVNASSQSCSVTGSTKTIHSTAWANFAPNGQVPTNDGELEVLAAQIASDYYKSFQRAYDRTFVGIKDWYFTGYDDHLLVSIGEDSQPVISATTEADVLEDGQEVSASTEIQCQYVPGYFTRVQSAPANFGVDEMLHQGTIVLKVPAGVIPMTMKAGEILIPGTQAIAYFLVWNGTEWVEDPTKCEQTVYDPHYRNCLIQRERFYVRRSCENGRLEIVGENGLHRLGRILTDIQGGSSGTVELVTGPMAVFGTATCDRLFTGLGVVVCNPPGAPTLRAGDLCYINYHPDHFRWFTDEIAGGKLIRFEMKTPLPLGGQGMAIEVGTGPAFTPIGTQFPIKDYSINPGMFRFDPKSGSQARGYMGWCLIPDNPQLLNGVPIREIVQMEVIARSIEFNLQTDMSGGSAQAIMTNYYIGKDPSNTDLFGASQGWPGLIVYDSQNNYPHALASAKGKARYNDRNHRYEVIECNQMAFLMHGTLAARMCPSDATTVVNNFGPMTFAQYGMEPADSSITAINSYSLAGQAGTPILLAWNESFEQWEVTQIGHVARYVVREVAFGNQNCTLIVASALEEFAVMTCGNFDSNSDQVGFIEVDVLTGTSISHQPGESSTPNGPLAGSCEFRTTAQRVCVLAPDSPVTTITIRQLEPVLTVQDIDQEGNCIVGDVGIAYVFCKDDTAQVTFLCGDPCETSSSGGGGQSSGGGQQGGGGGQGGGGQNFVSNTGFHPGRGPGTGAGSGRFMQAGPK